VSVGAYVLTSVRHGARDGRQAACHCNFQLSDGSVRALQQSEPVSLAALTQGLRRPGGPARALASNTGMPALQALLAALRRQGVTTGALTVRPAEDPLPVLLVIADTHDFMPGADSALLFLVADTDAPAALLLPAIQCAREAANRLVRDGEIGLVLVQRPPGPGPRLATEQWSFNYFKL